MLKRLWRRLFDTAPLTVPLAVQHFGVLTMRQWSSQASLRLRRMCQLLELYKGLYNEQTVHGLLMGMVRRFGRRKRLPRFSMMATVAAAFSFQEQGISDAEMQNTEDLINDLRGDQKENSNPQSDPQSSSSNSEGSRLTLEKHDADGWEEIINRSDFKMWRRPVRGHDYLCEYKCAGSYYDIPASAFFVAQMDLEYRKKWDDLVICLEVVDSESSSGQEVVRWITHFPYPMYPREYLYVRRACVDVVDKTMLLSSKAVTHPGYPISPTNVRVQVYSSQMVIRPHSEFGKLGFDYVMTYFDDPQAPFPSPAYKWMVKYGVPGFVDKVYHAAKALHAHQSKGSSIEEISYIRRFLDSSNQQGSNVEFA